MFRLNTKLMPSLLLSAALVAGCGGGGGAAEPPAPGIGESVTALLDFVAGLIAGSSETTEPMDISTLTLAVDDTAEATLLAP